MVYAESAAIAFADRVRKYADLIVLIDNRQFLPSRWTTADGRRPLDPHRSWQLYTIITPEHAEVVRVAKGAYNLPQIYFANFGGVIDQDCAYGGESLYLGGGPAGTRFLYLASVATYPEATPLADDPRYRYYSVTRRYPVSPDGLITIGPERDIMGNKKDDPPRTLTVDEVFSEIAALLGSPATPTPKR
ncbi:MAG: hypothetical protein U0232_33380 [Thermomicrobiales bacterium]